jgi:cytochrome c553
MRLPQSNLRSWLITLAAMLSFSAGTSFCFADAAAPGAKVYKDQCARCHGKSGEGTDDNYADPLEGDKSIAQLTKLIHETMPDDAEKKASPEDAAAVADYIYNASYSPEARVRNKPARIELSRLTVRQYQNAVADLVGSFHEASGWGTERGLHAEYFQKRNPWEAGAAVVDRNDPQVEFDFGTDSPSPGKINT